MQTSPGPTSARRLDDALGRPQAHGACDVPFWGDCGQQNGSTPSCNPMGPDPTTGAYDPVCHVTPGGSAYFYFHGNRTLRAPLLGEMTGDEDPWRRVAQLVAGGAYSTATLISRWHDQDGTPRSYFLTAAHAIVSPGQQGPGVLWKPKPQLFLAKNGPNNEPYPVANAVRAWVPYEFYYGGFAPTTDVRAYDYAVVECEDIPGAHSARLTNTIWTPPWPSVPAITIGYACGRRPDPQPQPFDPEPDAGLCRVQDTPYYTDPAPPAPLPPAPPVAQYTNLVMDSNGGGGGVLVSNVEGTSSMSGAPMLVGKDRVLGVLVGAPCSCGVPAENWSAAITQNTHERILSVIMLGKHYFVDQFGNTTNGQDMIVTWYP